MPRFPLFAAALLAALLFPGSSEPGDGSSPQPRWWKGNTHTHSLWSDGDAAPEWIADWYRSHGFHFLVLSDHNTLSVGEEWFAVTEDGRLRPERVEELQRMFGEDAVELREREGRLEMRLQTLEELRRRFEEPGEFLFMQGEEITTVYSNRPVHVNGLNLAEKIEPWSGGSVLETVQRNVDLVLEQGRRLGIPVLAHVNHPNFHWGISVEELAQLRGDRFFEVYNGHAQVRNYGDDEHPGTEAMWDQALTARLVEHGLGLLYGLAVDDAHAYHRWGTGRNNPGRGWVMVRAPELSAEALIAALRAGDFYASTGVDLVDFGHDDSELRVHVEAEPELTYTTQFVGTRLVEGRPGEVGELLLETRENPAVYRFQGDELYVRARVVSSRPHPNPYAEGDLETAWVQPVVPPR